MLYKHIKLLKIIFLAMTVFPTVKNKYKNAANTK